MRLPAITTALLALTTLTGCNALTSADIETERINADIQITDDGTGYAQISAELTVDDFGSTSIDLVGGDALEVNHGRYTRLLQAHGAPLNWVSYSAEVPVDTRDVEFQVSMLRPLELSAPDSWVEMPAPFTPIAVETQLSFARDALVVEWNNATTDEMSLHVQGPCIFSFDLPVLDRGALSLELANLEPLPSWRGERCTLEVELSRSAHGYLDPAFRSGQIRANQVRRLGVDLYR